MAALAIMYIAEVPNESSMSLSRKIKSRRLERKEKIIGNKKIREFISEFTLTATLF